MKAIIENNIILSWGKNESDARDELDTIENGVSSFGKSSAGTCFDVSEITKRYLKIATIGFAMKCNVVNGVVHIIDYRNGLNMDNEGIMFFEEIYA